MNVRRAFASAAAALLLTATIAGCASETPPQTAPPIVQPLKTTTQPTPSSTPTPSAPPAVTFVAVVDGDTIETSAGTVRIIGIDTPERGECGHDEASITIGRLLAPGDSIALQLPAGQNDQDSYSRLLRYVATDAGVDLGLLQIEAGNAIARYDSADGYPAHPKESAYRAAQLATAGVGGTVITTACALKAPPIAPPVTTPDAVEQWWLQYSSCTKLKKNTVGHPHGPFSVNNPAEVDIYNWFAHGTGNRGDGDGDGLACE